MTIPRLNISIRSRFSVKTVPCIFFTPKMYFLIIGKHIFFVKKRIRKLQQYLLDKKVQKTVILVEIIYYYQEQSEKSEIRSFLRKLPVIRLNL